MRKKKVRTVAVIHLGSENITMQIVEYTDLEEIRVVEEVRHKVHLGEEAFQYHKISLATTLQIVAILQGFRQVMRDYGVKSYILQATTAVREAENRHYFIDQIKVKTGFSIDVVNMSQEIYTKLASLLRTLQMAEKKPEQEAGMLLADISSGGLGLTYIKNREVKLQQNLHVGLVRLKEEFTRNERSSIHFQEALEEYVADRLRLVGEELRHEDIRLLVLTGTESQVLLELFGKAGKKKIEKLATIPATRVEQLYQWGYQLTASQLQRVFHLSQEEMELAGPAMVLCRQLLLLSRAEHVVMPQDRFIDGMKILYIAQQTKDPFLAEMLELQMSLVRGIGSHFHYDAAHAAFVEKMCGLLFDTLAPSQGLEERDKIFLRAAAYLHNIGKYASMRIYDRYNYYLIESADILGFSVKECHIIAQVCYLYTLDKPELPGTEPLDFGGTVEPLVAKLAAILRLADSMDCSGKQKITGCKVEIREDTLWVEVQSETPLLLEKWQFAKRGGFFEEVFGLRPVLEKVREKE